ncbi:hypothetical protein IG631_22670 [Alternaria alternata]|nr:hypothetical protein IG631_22670 [Alternaria alternata]
MDCERFLEDAASRISTCQLVRASSTRDKLANISTVQTQQNQQIYSPDQFLRREQRHVTHGGDI